MKSCVADIAANFTTNRMLTDYQERYYSKLWARTWRCARTTTTWPAG